MSCSARCSSVIRLSSKFENNSSWNKTRDACARTKVEGRSAKEGGVDAWHPNPEIGGDDRLKRWSVAIYTYLQRVSLSLLLYKGISRSTLRISSSPWTGSGTLNKRLARYYRCLRNMFHMSWQPDVAYLIASYMDLNGCTPFVPLRSFKHKGYHRGTWSIIKFTLYMRIFIKKS